MTALVAILALAVIMLGVLVAGLLRSHAEILRTLHHLGGDLDPNREGTDQSPHAPRHVVPPQGAAFEPAQSAAIEGVTPALEPIVISVGTGERLTLLSFLTSGCLTCRSFWEEFSRPNLSIPGNARLVVIARGPTSESPADIARLAPRDHVTMMSNRAWKDFKVPGSPYFVLIGGEGAKVIGEGTASDWLQVSRLLSSALADAWLSETPGGPRIRAEGDENSRIDADLLQAGIEPGHPSLYLPADHAVQDDES